MCVDWVTMPDGNVRPCHRCWQCRRDRINDWVGRCIAESATSDTTLRLTLTYGRDDHYGVNHPRSQMLHYEDVQEYLKRLRFWTPGKVRFFCTGEYGTAKGRAHWHLILFFRGGLPPRIRLDERYLHEADDDCPLWSHGWSFWELADPEKMRYAVKYLLPDGVGGFDRVRRQSTRPELGREFFKRQASAYVSQGLPPLDTYRFPNDWDRKGRPREYRLTRAALYKFLSDYAMFWKGQHGDESWPQSELMDAWCDERARRQRIGAVCDVGDFVRRFELEQREKRLRWASMIDVDGTGVAVAPARQGPGYRESSRGA